MQANVFKKAVILIFASQTFGNRVESTLRKIPAVFLLLIIHAYMLPGLLLFKDLKFLQRNISQVAQKETCSLRSAAPGICCTQV